MSITQISDKTSDTIFDGIYSLPVGSVIKIEGNLYETVLIRIINRTPVGKQYEVTSITPGTDLFTLYGSNHLLVTKNQ